MAEQRSKTEMTSIVRLAGRDVDGSYKIQKALSRIKGMGNTMAHAITMAAEKKLGISRSTQIGSLSEEQIAKLEELFKNPKSVGVPDYLLNRRNDHDTGQNIHVLGTDLIVAVKQDVERDIKAGTWRGFRHQYGQRVRGQRTRSTGRTGATIGVTKGKEMPGTAGAATAAQNAQAATAAPAKGAAPAAKPAAPAAKPQQPKK